MKISAVAVNGDTWSPSLSKVLRKGSQDGFPFTDYVTLQRLDEHRHQAVLTSPEMCLKHLPFRKWLTSKETADKIAAIIVDEAHCISQWGGDFRPLYAQLEKLRSFMPPEIPILLTSATLPPAALSECCARMNVELRDSFFLNLGNHRPNIATTVLRMDGSKDYKAIYDVLPDPNSVSAKEDFKKTIIFTNSVNATQILCRDVRRHYGPNFRRHIDFLHAHRTAKAKRRVMKLFRQGVIKLLIATEAAGMVRFHTGIHSQLIHGILQGADIPDIELVIQFGVPASLSIFSQ
jgi:bloom syndrome protein